MLASRACLFLFGASPSAFCLFLRAGPKLGFPELSRGFLSFLSLRTILVCPSLLRGFLLKGSSYIALVSFARVFPFSRAFSHIVEIIEQQIHCQPTFPSFLIN